MYQVGKCKFCQGKTENRAEFHHLCAARAKRGLKLEQLNARDYSVSPLTEEEKLIRAKEISQCWVVFHG